jgi:hypothetical protein
MVDHGCTLYVFIPRTLCMQCVCVCVCVCVCGLFVTLCDTCSFYADERVCISQEKS